VNIDLWEKILALSVERDFYLGVWPRVALFFSAPFRGLQYFTVHYEITGMKNHVRIRGYMDQRKGTVFLVAVGRYIW
jgi:hypothetical protein